MASRDDDPREGTSTGKGETMGHAERANANATADASVIRGAGMVEGAHASGIYKAECLRPIQSLVKHYKRISDKIHALQAHAPLFGDELLELIRLQGQMHDFATVQWKADAPNVVMKQGKDVLLNLLASTASYTATGPFLGLISNVSWSAVSATGDDTMASHSGWTEAGATNAPTYTFGGSGVRATPTWAAASGGSKADTTNNSFLLTSGTNVTIQGCFLVYGTIPTTATNAIDSTVGALWSAGVFSGGAKTNCNSGDTVNCRYTTSL